MAESAFVYLFSIQSIEQNPSKNLAGASRTSYPSNSHLANPVMVLTAPAYVNTKTVFTTEQPRLTAKPTRGKPPTNKRKITASSGLENLRHSLQMEGISSNAANLISNSRRQGTLSNYSSSWAKWASWCSQQQIDPFLAPVKDVVNFLAELFHDKNFEWRTMNNYRSAISAYHIAVEGKPVGQHPLICALLLGIFIAKPPQPRYVFIWDVEVVLNYVKNNWSDNNSLSLMDLTLKLTVLLALTASARAGAIHHLDVNFMVNNDRLYIFYFSKLHKAWRNKKPPPAIKYFAYDKDQNLCVVKTLDDYICRTKDFREKQSSSQLLLSTMKPHGPVVSSTVSGWLKKVLGQAGINTDIFKGHSTRSASSSKVGMKGAPIQEILKRGSWSSERTRQSFYNKEIIQQGELFQDIVYKK